MAAAASLAFGAFLVVYCLLLWISSPKLYQRVRSFNLGMVMLAVDFVPWDPLHLTGGRKAGCSR